MGADIWETVTWIVPRLHKPGEYEIFPDSVIIGIKLPPLNPLIKEFSVRTNQESGPPLLSLVEIR